MEKTISINLSKNDEKKTQFIRYLKTNKEDENYVKEILIKINHDQTVIQNEIINLFKKKDYKKLYYF